MIALNIAQTFARGGYDVMVWGISDALIRTSRARLRKRLDRLVDKGWLDEKESRAAAGRLRFTTDLDRAANADLVLEAAVEDLEIKRSIFSELDKLCARETILASNTSSVSITAIAAATGRPDKFVGMHFFNPVAEMEQLEVIRGARTSDETCSVVSELARAIGKTPVEVSEAPGFVMNKSLISMINKGIDLVYTGMGTVEGVDTAMRLGAGCPIGPLAMGDLVGLDVCLTIMDTLYDSTRDPKYHASQLLRKMVRTGRLGRKTGRGFYDYRK